MSTDLNHQSGEHWPTACDPHRENLRRTSRGPSAKVGSTRLQYFRERRVMTTMSASERVLIRSQSGPGAGVSLSATPSNSHNRIESHLFRVLLQRRLRLRLPLSSRFCRCGRPFDAFGHHRAACSRTGELGRRGFALESAGARICREAGGQSRDQRHGA